MRAIVCYGACVEAGGVIWDDQKPMSPGRWARSLRGKRYRISPCSPLKQEVSEITSILNSSRRPSALIGAPRLTYTVKEGVRLTYTVKEGVPSLA